MFDLCICYAIIFLLPDALIYIRATKLNLSNDALRHDGRKPRLQRCGA